MDSSIVNVSINSVVPNRFQPRINFEEKALNELAESIKLHGIIQPLVVRPLADKYEIIAGERRFRAAQLAGFTEVPVIVSKLNDTKIQEVALVENLQRKDLTSIEEARSFKRMLDKDGLTQEELANKVGLSQSAVANKLRLLNLKEEVQEALLNSQISERHARSLLQLNDASKQVELLNRIISERLTVRQVDEIIKDMNMNSTDFSDIIFQTNESSNNEPVVTESVPVTETLPVQDTVDIQDVTSEAVEEKTGEENSSEETPEVPDTPVLETFEDLGLKEKTIEDPRRQYVLLSDNILNAIDKFNNTEKEHTLEDEQTNMATFEDDMFADIFNRKEEVVVKEEPKEVKIVKTEPDYKIEKGNLESVKEAFNKLQAEVEKCGFTISSEAFDFEDLYQMIIKIDK